NAATPGPWTKRHRGGSPFHCGINFPDPRYNYETGSIKCCDVAFIAAARTDVPTLVAEVRRLRDWQRWACIELRTAALVIERESGSTAVGIRKLLKEASE